MHGADLFGRYFRGKSIFDPRLIQVGSVDRDLGTDSDTAVVLVATDSYGHQQTLQRVNSVTYSLGRFFFQFFQIALVDIADEEALNTARRLLGKAREAAAGSVMPLRYGVDTDLPTAPLTDEQQMQVREPVWLLGITGFVGNDGVTLRP